MPRRKKRRGNKGSFRPVSEVGPDPRRHVFTAQDCRIGYLVAAIKHPELREWLRMRIRIFYHERNKHDSQESGGAGPGLSAADTGAGDDIPF